jgi:NitT/TauT family transport system substrate-binding protein
MRLVRKAAFVGHHRLLNPGLSRHSRYSRKRYPTIKVEYMRQSGRVLAERIIREHRAGKYNIDIVGTSAQSLPKVVIGYPARSIASVQLFIAQEKGFFREEGLEAQLNQVRADAAIAAVLTGELFAYDSVGTSVRTFQRGAPIKVLAVNLQSPQFWLVTRPELKSFSELKGKVMGTTSFGGVQHLAGLRMLRRGGLNPEEDITVILAGDTATQLQSIANGAIHIAVLSPPT